MDQTSTEKLLKNNENLFIVLDSWMQKYNTSPKALSIYGEEVTPISIEWNQKDLTPTDQVRTIKTLKEWAARSHKIIILTGVCISVYATSALIIRASLNSKNQENDNLTSIISEDEETRLTSGVYYLDENNLIAVEEATDVLLSAGEAKARNETSYSLPGSELLENAFIKRSLNQIIEGYIQLPVNGIELSSDEIEVTDEQVVASFPMEDPVITDVPITETPYVLNENGGVEIVIPTYVRQTGLCRNYTGYDKFYGRWSKNSMQRVLSEQWGEAGKPSSNGIATLNGCYLVAVSPKFGKVGDYIEIVLRDGQVIPAIIADSKGSDATSEWGHVMTASGAVDIIEWEASGPKSEIDLGTWKNVAVEKIINYGKAVINTPVPVSEEVNDVEAVSTEEVQQYSEDYTEINEPDDENDELIFDSSEETPNLEQKIYTLS